MYSVLVELKNKGAHGRPRFIWEIILKWILIKTNSCQFLVQHIKEDRFYCFCIHFTRKKFEIFKYTTVCFIIVTHLHKHDEKRLYCI